MDFSVNLGVLRASVVSARHRIAGADHKIRNPKSEIAQIPANLLRATYSPAPGFPMTFPSRDIDLPRWITSQGAPRIFIPSYGQ